MECFKCILKSNLSEKDAFIFYAKDRNIVIISLYRCVISLRKIKR